MTRVLIIGGYGNFGSKLASLLKDDKRLTIILAGRDFKKAKYLCRRLADEEAEFEPLRLDRKRDLAAQIGAPAPDIIVDASGPFQAYGTDPYRVIEYAIKIGAHYLDLADGTEFVTGVSTLDAKAKAAKVTVISGLSTYPALTSAVLIHCQKQLKTVTHLRAGISPSPHTDLGRSVINAITSYAGKPIAGDRHGLTESFMARICPPGALPLERLVFSDVDVPDAVLFPEEFESLKDVRNAAGPKPLFLHLVLMGLSNLRKYHIFPSLRLFAPIIHACSKIFRFGPHRGGMMIKVTGTQKDDSPTTLTWHLVAEGDDGPHIPAIPAAILIRKLLTSKPPKPGARPAVGAVTLAEYQAVFDTLRIQTGIHKSDVEGSLYECILGEAYTRLPRHIQNLHRPGSEAIFSGEARIDRGRNPIAHLIAAIFRLPKSGVDVPLTVTFSEEYGVETWIRNFGGRKMVSTQELGTDRYERLMVERFGPIAIGIALVVRGDRLYNITQSWSIFGVPMPRFLLPGGDIFEHAEDGRFNFHVDIKAPLIGRLVRYRGWLKPG